MRQLPFSGQPTLLHLLLELVQGLGLHIKGESRAQRKGEEEERGGGGRGEEEEQQVKQTH